MTQGPRVLVDLDKIRQAAGVHVSSVVGRATLPLSAVTVSQVREVTVDSDYEATWEIGEPVPVEEDADQDTEVQENCHGSDLTA